VSRSSCRPSRPTCDTGRQTSTLSVGGAAWVVQWWGCPRVAGGIQRSIHCVRRGWCRVAAQGCSAPLEVLGRDRELRRPLRVLQDGGGGRARPGPWVLGVRHAVSGHAHEATETNEATDAHEPEPSHSQHGRAPCRRYLGVDELRNTKHPACSAEACGRARAASWRPLFCRWRGKQWPPSAL